MQSSVHTSLAPRHASPKPAVFVALGAVTVALLVLAAVVGLRVRSSPMGSIDTPPEGAVLTQQATVSGWAIDHAARGNTGVDAVTLYVDGREVGDAYYGIARTDLGAQFGLQYVASGWSIRIEPAQLGAGSHTLEARAHSNVSGQDSSYTRTIEVPEGVAASGSDAPPGSLVGSLDTPESGAVISGLTDVRGWALDAGATNNTGIDRVQLYVDDALVGDAQYGERRPDVATRYGQQFAGSGWSTRFDPATSSVGPHMLEARVHTLTGAEATYTTPIVIEQGTYPRGSLDVPTSGQTVAGNTAVAGWAIDLAAHQGTGIARVQIYIDGTQVATANMGQTRPEIGAAYGQRFSDSGWTAEVDLADVAPGPHTLVAMAESQLTGQETSYTAAITVH
jgi:N-acetylmuramoyl-L-alanine amidase